MPDFDLTPVDYDPFADASNVVSGVPVQQGGGRLTINPQRGQAVPEGLPPPQPTPPSIQTAMEHQQNWGMPSAGEQLGNIGASVLANPVTNIAQRGAEGSPQPPLSDDPAEMDRYQEAQKRYYGGNFMDVLGLAAPQMAAPERSAAGIFGGKGAKTADLNKLVEAQRMFKEGVSNRQIWESTGWMMGPDTKWRFEIPDFGTTMLKKPTFGVATLDTAKDVLEHPELYKAYPDLGDAWVRGMRSDAGNMGEYHAPGMKYPRDEIGIRNNLEDPRSTMLHELQHGVQAREGFDPGANTEIAGGYENYRRNIGEVEARNVQQRRNVPPQDLIYPRDTEDVPLLQQLHYAELPGVRSKLGALGSGDESKASMAVAPAGWISQRLPTGKNATENPFTQQLLIDSNAMRNDPNWEHHIGLTRDYVNFAGEKERAAQANMPENVETQYRRFVDHAKDNLRFIYDNYKQFRDRSKLWYDGANHIATAQAEKYGLTVPQTAAVYAALSPQKDWFQNVSLGNRVLEIYHNHANEPFTPQMMETAKRIYRPTSKDPAKAAEQAKDAAETIKRISSGPLSAMKTTDDKAAWLRAYDETNFEPHYHVISPEGDTMELQTTNAGKPRKMAWGSLDQIGKAIDAIESGGNIDRISELMGERHKVRNFYNNILHPNSPMGDVTIDTHAVAAALMRPFSGNSTEVLHNFKTSPEKSKRPEGFVPSRGSAITGAQGTYGLYADAYRELAQELGLKPRELQSITWEGIRGLFPAEDKRGSLPQVVDQIWRRKDLSPAQKREMIRDQAGGFRPPDWHD